MKKVILILFLFSCAVVKAQNPIPNPSFENWTDHGNYSDPDGWQSDNYVSAGFGVVPVEPDTVPQEGELCAKLVTKGGDTLSSISAAGILCAGTFNSTILFCDGGFPCPQTYNYFNGYAFYTPVGDDKAGVAAYFFKWNENKNARDTIGVAFSPMEDTGGDYVYFSLKFSFISLAEPDSACVILASSTSAGNNPPKGSKLRVDNLEFSDVTGIDEATSNASAVFPNPADDKIIFQMTPTPDRYTLNIYDAMGRQLKSILLRTNHYQINTTNFSQGMFYYSVNNESGKVVSSGSFMVQH